MNSNELYHYGVLGMKWGKRKAASYEAVAKYYNTRIDAKKAKGKLLTVHDGNNAAKAASLQSRANDLKSDKKVSIRERQRKSDMAIRKSLQESKAYNRQVRADRKAAKVRNMSADAKEAYAIKKKKVSEMSNAELRKLNDRQNLERNYKSLNQSTISKGIKAVTATAAVLGSVVALKNNGKQVIDMGKSVVNRIIRK